MHDMMKSSVHGVSIRMVAERATDWEVIAWVKEAVNRGAGEILITSMDNDGEKQGFNLALDKSSE